MNKKETNQPKSKDSKNMNLGEPQALYSQKNKETDFTLSDYITLDEFRVEAKKRAGKLLKNHGIHK